MEQTIICIDKAELVLMLEEAADKALRKAKEQLPRFYSGKEVCAMLHITPQTLCNMQSRGDIQPLRIGGRVLFDAGAIDRAVSKGTIRKGKH